MKPLLRAVLCIATATATPLAAMAMAQSPPPARAHAGPKRGDYLPADVLHAGPNLDAAAAHLRRSPAGYGWFSLAGVYVLASVSTGLIVEVVAP